MSLNKSIFAAFLAVSFAIAPVMAQEDSQSDNKGSYEGCTDDGTLCMKIE